MNVDVIRALAEAMNIDTCGMKTTALIRAIQRTERGIDCFASSKANDCNENECWWRNECFSNNEINKTRAWP